MIHLTYDSETLGLPVWGSPSSDPAQPRIISLAADLHDDDGRTLGAMNVLIRPDGWTVPTEVTELTGITTDMCEKYGVPMLSALPMFIELWQRADQRIGHNESFDMRMVRIELVRHPVFAPLLINGIPFADRWKAAPSYCTMAGSSKIFNDARPAGEKKKFAKLSEAYKHFTGRELENAHSAWADTQACKTVWRAIQQLNQEIPA